MFKMSSYFGFFLFCLLALNTSGALAQSASAQPDSFRGIIYHILHPAVSGQCGPANSVAVTSAPTAELCVDGSTPTVSGTGPWSWTCAGNNGGQSVNCSAPVLLPPVNGICGTANKVAVLSVPTTNLCATGSASVPTGVGPWSWSCLGANGGTNSSCSAPLAPPAMCGTHASGTTYSLQLSSTPGTIPATIAQCPYGGTQADTTVVTQSYLCTNGTQTAQGSPVSTVTDNGAPSCNAPAMCGTHASGTTYSLQLSSTPGTIPATIAQCPYGGTQADTTVVTQSYLCTNGTQTAQGSPVSTVTDNGAPSCNAPAMCGTHASGTTYSLQLSSTPGTIPATIAQCPYGGTQADTTVVTQSYLCTNGTQTAQGSPVSTVTDNGAPSCNAPAMCGTHASGTTYSLQLSSTPGTIPATIAQCPYGGTQADTTVVTQSYLCTNGTQTAQGSPVSTVTDNGAPSCNAPAMCGTHASGTTYSLQLSSTPGTIPATIAQCPYGGTQADTTVVTQSYLCTNGTQTAQGSPVSTVTDNGAPSCNAPAMCGTHASGTTYSLQLSSTPGTIPATIAQCPYGGTQADTTVVTQSYLCTNGTQTAQGSPVSTVTDNGAPSCNAPAMCGTHASGTTYSLQLSSTPGTIPATIAQCPYGGTQADTTVVTQSYLCTNGTQTAQGSPVSTVTDNGAPSCNPAPINGACGSANGIPSKAAPTSGLCASGSSSSLSGSGPWTWACYGANGGSSVRCSAPINEAFGDAAFAGFYATSGKMASLASALPSSVYSSSVDGVFIRLLWEVVQPTPSTFDWSTLDQDLLAAVAAHKKVEVVVIPGGNSPKWLSTAYNVPINSFQWSSHGGQQSACQTLNIPTPWDPNYQAQYVNMINNLGAHIRSIPGAYQALSIVKINGVNSDTEETYIPSSAGTTDGACHLSDAITTWEQAGYTPDKVIAAWKFFATAINAQFPDKLLAMAILNVNDFPPINNQGQTTTPRSADYVDVEQANINNGIAMFPGRFSVQWNGLSTEPLSTAASVVVNAGQNGALVAWQSNLWLGPTEGGGCLPAGEHLNTDAIPCPTSDDYQAILNNGVGGNGLFIEVWPPNILEYPAALVGGQITLSNKLNSTP